MLPVLDEYGVTVLEQPPLPDQLDGLAETFGGAPTSW